MNQLKKLNQEWTSLAIQWLRLHASSVGDASSIPGQGTGIPCVVGLKNAKKKKKKKSTIRERRGQIKDNDCFESGLFLVDLEGVLGLFFSEGIRVLNRLVAW